MKSSIEALVFLAKHEHELSKYHERLMLVAALYSAGASVINIATDDDGASDGVTVHLSANSKSTRKIEKVFDQGVKLRVMRQDIKQRGNTVRVYWAR